LVNVDGPIVFAYDGSPAARAAIALAGRHLRPEREAIVLTVYRPLESVPFFGEAGIVLPTGADDQIRAGTERLAQEGVGLAREAGFDATAITAEASDATWETIVAEAKQRNASQIVMGTHGRTGVRSVLLGSVATAVMHHAGVPVTVVPAAFLEGEEQA
jgi:nucleotide-binding universal stress UspA family protein